MGEVLQTNIFFLITSISVVVFSVFVCAAVYYVIRILRNVARITARVDEKSEEIISDMTHIRTYVVTGKLMRVLADAVLKAFRPKKSRATRTTMPDNEV